MSVYFYFAPLLFVPSADLDIVCGCMLPNDLVHHPLSSLIGKEEEGEGEGIYR